MNKQEDKVLMFLNTVSQRIGPVNAMGMLKDANIAAFQELFTELGIPQAHVTEVIEKHLEKMAQKVLQLPVPSPINTL